VALFSLDVLGAGMANAKPSKIVYLFGAGATHAELQNIEPDLVEKGHGLLVSNVSSRVIAQASRDKKYLKGVSTVSGTSGSLNIELLISLIENSKIHDWEYKTRRLETLVQEDIERVLSPPERGAFTCIAFATTAMTGLRSNPRALQPFSAAEEVVVPLPFQGSISVEPSARAPLAMSCLAKSLEKPA
jgi:hypothetical protein